MRQIHLNDLVRVTELRPTIDLNMSKRGLSVQDARRIHVPECRRCLQQGAVRRAAFSCGRLSTCSCELTWPMVENAG